MGLQLGSNLDDFLPRVLYKAVRRFTTLKQVAFNVHMPRDVMRIYLTYERSNGAFTLVRVGEWKAQVQYEDDDNWFG